MNIIGLRNVSYKIVICLANLMLSLFLLPTIYGESETHEYSYNLVSDSKSSRINSSNSGQESVVLHRNASSNVEKAVIIMFDRGHDTQFTNAKPILDKYGFKASFFIICSFIDGDGYYKLSNEIERIDKSFTPMSWDQIKLLHKEGHDIESHGMEHRYLYNLSSSEDLEREIAGSKDCLEDQRLKPTYFQIPFNRGADNSTILKMISKHYDFGLSGHSRLMFLNCDGWVNHGFKTKSYRYQIDCNPFSDEGIPTRTNKYAIREWSHDRFHSKTNNQYPHLDPHGNEISKILFSEFVNLVESQRQYNEKAGKIVAVPIIGYHSIDKLTNYDTSKELFDREMQYLFTNGFKVLKFTDLGYNEQENFFYIK